MSWRNHWNRRLDGWVERKRRFRKVTVAIMRELASPKKPTADVAMLPVRALDPRTAR